MTPSELLELRKQKGWTQARLAEELGCHQSQVSRWESGKRPVPKWVKKSIARRRRWAENQRNMLL